MVSIASYVLLTLIILLCIAIVFLLLNSKDNKIYSFIYKILKKIKDEKIILLIMLFSFLLSISYLFLPGYIEGHDLVDRLDCIIAISDEIKRGIFPSFIMTDFINGYGIGSELTYTMTFYYFPAFLCSLGLSVSISYRIFMILIIVLSLLSMYICIYKIIKSKYSASIFSSLYITSSYFFTDLYIRADYGENLTMIFIPLIILGLYKLIFDNEKEGYWFTIGLVGSYLAHILSCYLVIYLVLIIVLLNIKRVLKDKNRIKYLLLYGFLAVLIVSFFWLPMFDSFKSDNLALFNYVTDDEYNTFSVVNPLFTILETNYDKYYPPYNPPGIGIIFVILLFIYIKNKLYKNNIFFRQLVILGFVFLFASTSLFPWKIFYPILGIMEFPWRFYMFVTSCLIIGFSIVISEIEKRKDNLKVTRYGMIVITCICFTFTLFTYNYFIKQPAFIREVGQKFSVGSGVDLPQEVDKKYLIERGEIITYNNKVDVNFVKNGSNIEINYQNNNYDNTYLDLPLVYYKGYIAKENGNKLDIEKSNEGIIRVHLDNTEGTINVKYSFTACRYIGLVLSLLSSIFFVYTIKRYR